jgi:hypothetical protein
MFSQKSQTKESGMRTIQIASLLLMMAAGAPAAEIAGKWSGEVPGRGGDTTPATFTFKVDGEKLTGSMTGAQGELPLQEGKVSGNEISFSTTFDAGGNSIKILYKGTLSGDQLKMTRQREGASGQAREFTLKRAGS